MYTDSEINTIIKAIEHYGKENQIIVAIEEISELLYALEYGDRHDVLEECADVQLSLLTLKFCGIKFGDVFRFKLTKLQTGLNLIKGLTKILRKDTEITCEYNLLTEMQYCLDRLVSYYDGVEEFQHNISAKLKRLKERIKNADSSDTRYNFYEHRFMAQK